MKWTKEYRAEYMRKWRKEHKEHINEYMREYYIKSVLNGTLKYYPPKPEKAREYSRAYYQRHKEDINKDEQYKKLRAETSKRWIANNRDKWNKYQREYKRKMREKALLTNA